MRFTILTCCCVLAALVACSNDEHPTIAPAATDAALQVEPTAAAPTDADIAADKAHCDEVAKTIESGLAAITESIASNDGAALARAADISERVAASLSPDQASPAIRTVHQHVQFMSDAAGAVALEAKLATDAANYIGGDTTVKITDLRHEASYTQQGVAAMNQDIAAYRGDGSSSPN